MIPDQFWIFMSADTGTVKPQPINNTTFSKNDLHCKHTYIPHTTAADCGRFQNDVYSFQCHRIQIDIASSARRITNNICQRFVDCLFETCRSTLGNNLLFGKSSRFSQRGLRISIWVNALFSVHQGLHFNEYNCRALHNTKYGQQTRGTIAVLDTPAKNVMWTCWMLNYAVLVSMKSKFVSGGNQEQAPKTTKWPERAGRAVGEK